MEQKTIDPWRFDAARNESMKLIPPEADICCCIDLDEQFHSGWRAALESAWQPGVTRARYRYTWSFNSDGSEGHVFWPEKIHKNGVYHWTHPVHEVLEYTGTDKERCITAHGVQLDHHPDPTKSRGQYLPLLELAVAEAPDDDRSCHYLGREYMYHGEWQRAIDTLKQHLSLPKATWADERCASMRFIGRCYRHLGRDDLAAVWYHRAIAEAPHLREPYIDYAALLYTLGARCRGTTCPLRCGISGRSAKPPMRRVRPPVLRLKTNGSKTTLPFSSAAFIMTRSFKKKEDCHGYK